MSMLQALGASKETMKITLIGVIVKIITLAATSLMHIGMYSLILSEITNILIVVGLNIYYVIKYSKRL